MLSSLEKKLRLVRTYTAGHPLWAAWQVTYRCNFRCKFCNYWKDPMGKLPEPGIEKYALGAKKLASFGTMLISLAGGEPFIRKDLPQIVSEIAQDHMPFVTTNGWLVNQQNARAVFDAGLWGVSVSIDYANPAQHDASRGKQGAWEQAVRALEYFANARRFDYQRVNLMCVLLDDNIDQLEDLMQLARKYHAYFMVQPYSFMKTDSHEFTPAAGVSDKLIKMWKRNRNFLSNPEYLKKFDQFLAGGIPGCKAGRAFYNIDSTGDIAICVENKSRPIANLYRDASSQISRQLKRASKNNTCTCCWYNCRGEVESLYKPKSLFMSLPTLIFNNGKADGKKMGRWHAG